MNLRRRQLAVLLASILICAAIAGSATPAMGQEGANNLLVNGDFETWDWSNPGFPFQDGIPEVQVAQGWRAFYVDRAPAGVSMPEHWKRPEFRDVKASEYPYRVRSGALGQKYFTFGGQHIAGIYQQVGNITPGTSLRFSIYMQTWSCVPATEQWNVCPTGSRSNSPSPMHTRVGIDPFGGANPWSPNVIWSPEREAYDQWTRFEVDAVARASTVTVFTYSQPNWSDHVFRINSDVYIDEGSLIALNPVAATPTPSPPQAPAEPDSGLPIPPPQSDGATVHVVRAGQTLFGISRQFGVSMLELTRVNGIVNPNRIYVGLRLTIPAGGTTLPSTPAPPTAPYAPGGIYIVRRGDTLFSIARRHGVAMMAIAQANGIQNLNRIHVGQRLAIPGAPAAPD
jgi:LysM repeat protein